MAKDYAKIKALAQSILECIGDEAEGANPSLPKQKDDFNDGGQESLDNLAPAADQGDTGGAPVAKSSGDSEEKKRKKDSSLAMMGSMLASKFK